MTTATETITCAQYPTKGTMERIKGKRTRCPVGWISLLWITFNEPEYHAVCSMECLEQFAIDHRGV